MSSLQRRIKNIYKIPLLDMAEDQTKPQFEDPRSPSANISRTPVELHTYHIPNMPPKNIIPINSTRY
ncbi:unnamed protein product [Rotaria sp. Silwood2]|nr:unnamed protein product [Rotaria sp. Silwood2]CAF2641201.1 unnamed protein product [Rotaria sp. Silwood2]CAF3002355.1 unnamed protein product [Rotaria sp. Silwood2]CAF3036487.1 unnamed protein product [Rotaria sp. Silwood2]CAF3918844.1 unnamed protein product [Rotaria sp. Silwood2]